MRRARPCAMFHVRANSHPRRRATPAIAALRFPIQSRGASDQIACCASTADTCKSLQAFCNTLLTGFSIFAFMTNAQDQRSCRAERLGEVLGRVVWRLTTQSNSGSAFNGGSQDDERGAATGTDTPAAAGELADLGGEDGSTARQSGSGGRVRTGDLLVMSQAGYRCPTPHEESEDATAPVVAGGGPARNPHALSRATAPCPLGYG